MTSHTYELDRRFLLGLLGPPLIVVVAFAGLLHCGRGAGWWPPPRPTLDVDRTLLVCQVEASRAAHDADVLLLGDSSCLMDVSARDLAQQLGRGARSLATVSYLDLHAYARLLREYVAANPGRLRMVVLLMHPEALRRAAPEAYHVRWLEALLAGTEAAPPPGIHPRLLRLLGLDVFRGRLLSRVLPTPLGGAYGRFYGFSAELERYLAQHHGSAVDPDRQPFQGNTEYRLAPSLAKASASLRAAVPPGVQLVAGITPVPAGFAGRQYAATRRALLTQWQEWLQADVILDDLPPTLPDDWFVKTTHLSEAGQRAFTARLARALKPRLRQ